MKLMRNLLSPIQFLSLFRFLSPKFLSENQTQRTKPTDETHNLRNFFRFLHSQSATLSSFPFRTRTVQLGFAISQKTREWIDSSAKGGLKSVDGGALRMSKQ
ncbi:unnamed protein product [Rhodiola kirilowii]